MALKVNGDNARQQWGRKDIHGPTECVYVCMRGPIKKGAFTIFHLTLYCCLAVGHLAIKDGDGRISLLYVYEGNLFEEAVKVKN